MVMETWLFVVVRVFRLIVVPLPRVEGGRKENGVRMRLSYYY